MCAAATTYEALLAAPDLEKAVAGLSDFDLREVRAWLARGEVAGWPADRVHGVCILEGCGRFMKNPSGGTPLARPAPGRHSHGTEVGE